MRGNSRIRLATGVVALVAALSMAAIAVPAALASKGQDFRGKVVSTTKKPRSVTVDTKQRGSVKFGITNQTRYDHINGFSALKPGLRVEVKAKKQGGAWVATKIERPGSHH